MHKAWSSIEEIPSPIVFQGLPSNFKVTHGKKIQRFLPEVSISRPLKSLMAIRTLHDCPPQMNENLLISNSKLTSDSELIWWR